MYETSLNLPKNNYPNDSGVKKVTIFAKDNQRFKLPYIKASLRPAFEVLLRNARQYYFHISKKGSASPTTAGQACDAGGVIRGKDTK